MLLNVPVAKPPLPPTRYKNLITPLHPSQPHQQLLIPQTLNHHAAQLPLSQPRIRPRQFQRKPLLRKPPHQSTLRLQARRSHHRLQIPQLHPQRLRRNEQSISEGTQHRSPKTTRNRVPQTEKCGLCRKQGPTLGQDPGTGGGDVLSAGEGGRRQDADQDVIEHNRSYETRLDLLQTVRSHPGRRAAAEGEGREGAIGKIDPRGGETAQTAGRTSRVPGTAGPQP